ncbi:substrate-binding domain-containing protein [Desulfomonile tiedjei]|uniref:substrate-binding domain-containing protein n=1 Tax=Desulfomonile tiedjei TaxID=2358 RepID=UPI0002F155B5|nr:substrate-binding domain-containing protein [Desulfomonile tiedjei]
MIRTWTGLGFVSLSFLLALSMCENGFTESGRGVVRVRGSESMAHIMTMYAGEFSSPDRSCTIVVSGGANESGMETLFSGEAEVAMISNRLSKKEIEAAKSKGLDLQEAAIGWGGIVVIVNPANPVVSLTVDQARKLFVGELTSWTQVGGQEKPVQVIAINESVRSGSHKYLAEDFLHGNFAPGAKLVSFFRSIPAAVGEDENAIGLIRMRNLERLIEQGMDKKIKVVALKKDDRSPAIAPTRESIDEGTYPITRPYLLCVPANRANTCTMEFFKFCAARNPRPRDLESKN